MHRDFEIGSTGEQNEGNDFDDVGDVDPVPWHGSAEKYDTRPTCRYAGIGGGAGIVASAVVRLDSDDFS